MIFAALKLVPMKWWIGLALFVMYTGGLVTVMLKHEHTVLAKEKAAHAIQLREVRDTFQGQIQRAHDQAQKTLDGVNAEWQASWEQHTKDDTARATKTAAQAQTLKDPKEFDRYVTPAQLHRCPDVPRGYLLRRADAAAYANGATEAAGPPPQASELDQPSGIPFAALWPVDVDAAGAYRSCRERVGEWERWGADVDRWRGEVQTALEASPSK